MLKNVNTIKILKTPLGFLMFDIPLTDAIVNQFLRCRAKPK